MELNKLKVLELKQLLKDKKLSTTGNKQELIQRLQENQANLSYFDILPKDILNIVDQYRKENNINILRQVFHNRKLNNYINLQYFTPNKINDYFAKRNVDIKVKGQTSNYKVEVGNARILSDEELFGLLKFAIKSLKANPAIVNTILRDNGASFRIVKYGREGDRGDVSTGYEMSYVK